MEKFAIIVANAKRHTLGGTLTANDVSGLTRRAGVMGIGAEDAWAIIKDTPASLKVSRNGLAE